MQLFKPVRLMLLGAASVSAISAAQASTISSASNGITSTTTANTQTITQTTARGIINWNDLSVAAGKTLTFNQPDKNAITLNRVIGLPNGGAITPTHIDGTIAANGQVWILNPTGVLIGSSGRVNVGGLLASTLDMTDQAFEAAGNEFSLSGTSTASVINSGIITTTDSGYAVLAGGGFLQNQDEGIIQANLGTVAIGSGKAVTMSFSGDRLISFVISQPSDVTAYIENRGKLIANGGRVLMTTRTASAFEASVVNNSGLVQARSASMQNGEIILDAGPGANAYAFVNGTLDASGLGSGETGGTITASAREVRVFSTAKVLAKGLAGGGSITIGQGPFAGNTTSPTTLNVYSGSTIDASATLSGAGGTITLLSNINASASFIGANGNFYADGGSSGGAGGTISAYFSTIDLTNSTASLSARPGLAASLNFFSNDITLSNTSGGYGRIAPSDVENILNAGRKVSFNAIGEASGSGSIIIASGISKTSSAASTLNFTARNSINLNSGADIVSTGGVLNINFNADSNNDGIGLTRLNANISLDKLTDGLIGVKYEGYFNNDYSFFATAVPQQDQRFALPFTAINGTTPGANFDDTYSVKFSGYFKPTITANYFFGTFSHDESQVFVGSAEQSLNLFQSQVISAQGPTPLVNNAGGDPVVFRFGQTSQALIAGQYYPFVLLFGENTGGDDITLFYAAAGQQYSNNGLGSYFSTASGELPGPSSLKFSGDVQLLSNVSLKTRGDVTFQKAVDSDISSSGFGLSIDAGTGSVKFLNAVGNGKELSNLTVTAGSLEAGSIKLGNGAFATGVNSTGIAKINVERNSTVTGDLIAAQLVKTGAGVLGLSGVNLLGQVSIERGSLRPLHASGAGLASATSVSILSNGTLDLSQSPQLTDIKSVSGAGRINLGSGKKIQLLEARSQDVFSGKVIGGTASEFTVAGGTAMISSDLDFTGRIRVGNASLYLTGTASLADAAGLTFVGSNGGFLDLSGLTTASTTISNFYTDPTAGYGSVSLGATNLVVKMASGSSGVNTAKFYGTTGGLEKTGPGTLILAGNNSYAGVTRISDGILQVRTETQLGTGSLTLAGGTLRLTSSGAVSLTKAVTLVADSAIEFVPDVTKGFKVTWTGAQFQNNASAIGLFDVEASLFSQAAGSYSYGPVGDGFFVRDVTVQGAVGGNGSFGQSDFGSYVFSSAGSLNFDQELIGQPIGNGFSFGSFNNGYGGPSGDFNLFRNYSNVVSANSSTPPNGSSYFVLTTSGGDQMAVTSIVPIASVPQPANARIVGTINGGFGLKIVADGNLEIAGGLGATQALTRVTTKVAGTLTLGANAQINAIGDISLGTLTRFINQSVSPTALSSSTGSWRVFSGNTNPFSATTGDVAGNLNYQFKAYNYSLTNGGTDLHSFVAPGQSGFVYQYAPQLSITSAAPVTKVYDGSRAFSGALPTLSLSAGINGDVVSLGGTASGQFATANAGTTTLALTGLSVSALDSAGKPVFGYSVSPSASIAGQITPKPLTASLAGTVSRIYDGTLTASLASSNFVLAGLVTGETLTIKPTQGAYASKDAGQGIIVTASLSLADVLAASGTLASNYVLPTTASGAVGTITPKALTANLTGAVSRVYDGTLTASLASSNFALTGLVTGEALAIKPTQGAYASKDVGKTIVVTAGLATSDFAPTTDTNLNNYSLPATASGAIGEITSATLTYLADPAERPANTPNPVLSGSVTGFVAGETLAAATTGSVSFTTPAIQSSVEGTYAINGGGLTATNYVFSQAPSNATAFTVRAPLPNVTQLVTQTVVASTIASVAASAVVVSVPKPTVVAAPVAVSAPVAVATPAPKAPTPAAAPAAAPAATPAPAPAPAASPAAAPADKPASPPPAAEGSGSAPASDAQAGPAAEPAPPAKASDAPAPAAAPAAAPVDAPPPTPSAAGTAPPPPSAPAAPEAAAPPPPPPPSVTVVAVAAPPVEALPPSPVPTTPPPTPADAEDSGDPVLQSVAEAPAPPPPARRVGAIVNQLSPQVSVTVEVPVKVSGAAGIDTRYSLAGNPGGL